MAAVDAEKVRNVGIVGHGGCGKTTLIEHILHAAGKTNRIGSIESGNTVGDYLEEEIEHGHTVSMKLMHVDWDGGRVHLIDHPGYLDFVGELASSAAILDAMVIVVDATSGPRAGTDAAMGYADKYNIPRAIFLNKLDHENIDFDAAVAQIQAAYGPACVPLIIPDTTGSEISEVVNVVTGNSEKLAGKMETLKSAMMDLVAESDDELIEKYLEEGELSDEDFERGLKAGISSGAIVPIVAGSATKGLGLKELLSLLLDDFPSPLERTIVAHNGTGDDVVVKASPDEPFLGQVFRSVIDPYAGQLTLFRVLTGTLRSDSEFFNVTREAKERTGKIIMLCGKEQTQVDSVGPGDLAAMTKLKKTRFGDTIGAPGSELQLAKIELPESIVKRAITAKSRADEDKIGEALNRIAQEDPTFTHYRDTETNEHIIKGMGEIQLDIMLERMKSKYNVGAETHIPKVAYKETIKGTSDVQGKHKKQSGGHGQYGDVKIKLSPNERGAGYKFVDSVVGGVVPRQYIPHVDKGAQEALKRGVIAGYPVVDIVVELYFGSYHDVDSSEMAFKIAASHAINEGVKKARPCLIEPIVEIAVTVPTEFMGDINGDMSGRRGRIIGMEAAGPGREVVRATVPEVEILRYSTDLRSMTQGLGTYTYKFIRYDEVPEPIARELVAAHEKEKAGSA
ncbi:MAG: elongation factor G [Candidatus Hydrogenedentes bacterium]|nr:elongation factor G [Candidatus Hydrogenedentota bacterium]